MKKTPIILAASFAVLLSACGKKEAPPPAPPAETPAPTTPAPITPAPTTPPAPPASEAPSSPSAAAPTAPSETAAAPAAAGGGEATYKKVCSLCHAAGVGGAPKPGDKADWGPRIAQGKDTLYKHAIEGFTGQKGMMPPKGGSPALTDDEVKAAVDHMVGLSS